MGYLRRASLFIAGLLLLASMACSNSASRPDTPKSRDESRSSTTSTTPSGSPRELLDDENAGGHTLARHVGKSDDDLRDRLMHERIAAASTYTDHVTAERAIGAAIAVNQDKIHDWLASTSGHPNLVLDYDSPQPIGRSLRRNASASTPCSHALVVLKWRPPSSYYVLTSYPDCK